MRRPSHADRNVLQTSIEPTVAYETVPEWARGRLGPPTEATELPAHEVAAVLFDGDRPYFTRAQVQARLRERTGRDFSKDTVLRRLDRLRELDVARSDDLGNGVIYYPRDERSEWPIPPELAGDESPDETLSRPALQVAGLGVVCLVLAGLPMLWGTFVVAGVLPPVVPGTTTLAAGLSAVLVGYGLVAVGGLAVIYRRTTGESPGETLARLSGE